MLSIINIQFGKNKNNMNKIKKVYNQGNIITARPKTAKYPYKILSIKEFPKPIYDDKTKIKKSYRNSIYTLSNKTLMKKSFSFVEDFQRVNTKKNTSRQNNKFNQSSYDNNYIISSNYRKTDYCEEEKIIKILSSTHGKINTNSINNDNSSEFGIKKNRKLFIKRGFSGHSNNKKRVSSYSMSKYIEKYIDKDYFNNNKSININENTNNNDIYKINYDENTQVLNFLSEVINTENLKNNYNYKTTNNILKNYNKNKGNTRNLIIKRYNNNNYCKHNKVSLSYTKKAYNGLKPVIINVKKQSNFLKEINENNKNKNNNYIRKNNFLTYKKKFENQLTLKKNKSLSIKNKTESNEYNYRALSVEKDKNLSKEKDNKEKKNINIIKEKNKINNIKYKIKNKYKKKLKFHKDLKIKNKKTKIIKSHEVNNGFLKYLSDLKNDKFNYINNSNNYRGLKYGKNSDIYDYLDLPKESEKNDNDTLAKEHIEYKSVNQ